MAALGRCGDIVGGEGSEEIESGRKHCRRRDRGRGRGSREKETGVGGLIGGEVWRTEFNERYEVNKRDPSGSFHHSAAEVGPALYSGGRPDGQD